MTNFVRCPYCFAKPLKTGKKRPRWYKTFEVIETKRNFLIFKCLKCGGKFYYRFIGKQLTKEDIEVNENGA